MAHNSGKHAVWDRWCLEDGRLSLARSVRDSQFIAFSAEPESVKIDLAMCAFVVIDMQNDFLHPEGWFAEIRKQDVAPLAAITAIINSLTTAFRAKNAPVIHLNWGVRSDAANLPANTLCKASACGQEIAYADDMPQGQVLVADSWGSESVAAIKTDQRDFHVFKHRLSGFRDNELDQLLRRLGVTTIFYAGINLDRCVFATLMDGCFQGYDAILVEDACATASPEPMGSSILSLIRMLYGFTARSSDILSAIMQLDLSKETSTQTEGVS